MITLQFFPPQPTRIDKAGAAMSLPLTRMSRSVIRLLITQMCGTITRLITKATTRLLTQMGQTLTSLLTQAGQATLNLLSKVVQAITRSSTRQSYGCRSSRRPLIRIPTRSRVGIAGKPLPSSVDSSGGQDRRSIDTNVDNNDEHEAKVVHASPKIEEDKLADACGEDVVVGESSKKEELISLSSYKEEAVVEQVKVNESPEKQVVKWGRVGMYGGWQRILLVGEGDFSFSACLATGFGDASNMVATSLDTLDFLKKNYEKATDNIKELRSRGCKVIHRVDATKMANHPNLCSSKFDRIIYNFPHAGFGKLKESREVQISHHQALVLGFMENAKQMIEGDGQIHITHKCGSGFSAKWNIDQLGKSKGLHPLKAVKFKLVTYPGYHTKCGYGGDKDFDCNPSRTYKFILST